MLGALNPLSAAMSGKHMRLVDRYGWNCNELQTFTVPTAADGLWSIFFHSQENKTSCF